MCFQLDAEINEVTVRLVHPHRLFLSFEHTHMQDIFSTPMSDILTTVDPKTTAGHAYTLTHKVSRAALEKLSTTVLWQRSKTIY